MTRRELVKNAMHYRKVDRAPLQFFYTPVGFYEHGEKLNHLFAEHPGDFEPFVRRDIPRLGPEEFDADGRYHAFRTDEWGVSWEYRIFGIAGIPKLLPVTDEESMARYRAPASVALEGPEYEAFARELRSLKENDYYAMRFCGGIHERLLALYGDENVLCDIALDEKGLGALADRVLAYDLSLVERAVKAGADCVSFGDDFGTERGMIMSPASWRHFYKPRYKRLFQPALDAKIDIHFHSCGVVTPILEDLKELGVNSIWPQLPAYDMQELARICRSLGLAVAIHTDRANTMTYGTSAQVRDLVRREYDTFAMADGGSWFYVEADNGFPFENLRALVETIALYR